MASELQSADGPPPSATHLLASTGEIPDDYRTKNGVCCFCGIESPGQHVEEATSKKYFSDDPLLTEPASDHACESCAWTMGQRTFKQGHWIAHQDGVETPSTGDLLGLFRRLRTGEFEPPLAVHVTSSPIRSSHSYLWTPINQTPEPLTVAFDRETVRIQDWSVLDDLVAAIEDFRLHGFTFDELRSGEPRVRNLREIGRERYSERDAVIDPHRRTAWLDLALTLSRSADDQSRTDLTDHNPLTDDN